MVPAVTASMLYDLVQCPKRVELDLFADPGDRDEESAFVRMLWERGTLHERDFVKGRALKVLDLSHTEGEEKERLTLEAMRRCEPLIYSGRIVADGLVGVPDLLRFEGSGYVPVDIKSGGGEEGGDDGDGKPKIHYAVQLALYVDVLERLGQSSGRRGVIWDVHGQEVTYDLVAPRSGRNSDTLWDEYCVVLSSARSIADRTFLPQGALASACKLCHWYSTCTQILRDADDLTLIPSLGRAIRDGMQPTIPTVAEFAAINPNAFIDKGKTPFKGLGPDRLKTFHARAQLLTDPNAKPYLKAAVTLPMSSIELFFDIEVDPLRDFVYLHGIIERHSGKTSEEKFVYFFTEDESPQAERDAFERCMAYLNRDATATIWYYSKYERTIYRKLQGRYPDVCTAQDVEALFDPKRAIDLYSDVVTRATEWPTNDQSIKTLAKYLGFSWRDSNPSGAASIEWFDRWVNSRDPAVRERILQYNEDDCKATRVLLDGIRALSNFVITEALSSNLVAETE